MSITDDQLAAIEARADDYNRYERCNELEVARKIIGRDIPALVAEVRRLRELCAECIESIEDWAGYASDYYREKHGYEGEINDYKARLNGAESEGA